MPFSECPIRFDCITRVIEDGQSTLKPDIILFSETDAILFAVKIMDYIVDHGEVGVILSSSFSEGVHTIQVEILE